MPLNLTLPQSALSMPADTSSQPQTSLEDQLATRAGQPSQPQSMSNLSPTLAPLLGGAMDVLSTQRALSHGYREANPLLPQGRVGNGLALAGSYAANALASHLLQTHGHPTLAKILGYGGGINGALFGAHNMELTRDRDPVGFEGKGPLLPYKGGK